MRAGTLAQWRAFTPRTRRWLVAIVIGVVIQMLLHLAEHTFRWSFVVNAQNAALDGTMRVSAATVADDPAGVTTPPKLVFVDIDDATWRDPRWGGGEPNRAPREAVFALIEHAFRIGARQVVLDIAIEGRSAQQQDRREDVEFAARLDSMLTAPWFTADRQLVLVRTLRQPLPLQTRLLTADTDNDDPYPEGYLDELRASPTIDPVIARSQGRIVVAAPLFSISPDRVLRDWQLLQVVCERVPQEPGGVVRVVPSVQLAVVARHVGMAAGESPWQTQPGREPGCRPFPVSPTEPAVQEHMWQTTQDTQAQADAVIAASWAATRDALKRVSVSIGPDAPRANDLGNRVVFRWAGVANAVAAIEVLFGQPKHELKDRVVLIGQTFAEAGDTYFTPLGQLNGSVVLLNAIDSMARYGVIETPRKRVTLSIAFALIVFVGYVYARWNSLPGTLIATGAILAVLPWFSFILFKHGVWLDFALPLLGIQAQHLVKTLQEYLHRRQVAGPPEQPAAAAPAIVSKPTLRATRSAPRRRSRR